jgi:trans-aconitate methyltransferase
MALSDFDSPVEWGRDLDRRWPVRGVLRTLVVKTIQAHCTTGFDGRVLELGVGDGELMRMVRGALPAAQLIGIDAEPTLLEHAHAIGGDNEFCLQDLNEPNGWQELLQSVHMVYSMQTFHDLGGYSALHDVYRHIHETLVPGGLMLNADFVVPQSHDDPSSPRRFGVDVHLALLEEVGFVQGCCLMTTDDFACLSALKSH